MPYQIGDRVGDYEIVAVLGEGGMGKVYKVRNTISDRVEAMKVLLPNLESNADLADRFLREIKVQATLDHPNIAGLHTALRVNNQLVMLLEFVEGRTLEAELRKGPIPVQRAIEYIQQALAALSSAHSRGVVHRDIKPSNMMLTSSGIVKLMDFGIARIAADRKLTQTGQTVGSLYYMSPEQIQGSADLDERSDLYSLGVTLYEMCTNRRPFQGDSDYSIMAAHLNSSPIPPIEIDPSLPPALNDIILMSIAKNPAKRFQSADAFRAALNSTGSTATVTIASTSPTPPPSGRRGLYMAIGSVVTIAVLAVAAFEGPKLFRSSSASAIPPSTTTQPVTQQPMATPPKAPKPLAISPPQTMRKAPIAEPTVQQAQNTPPNNVIVPAPAAPQPPKAPTGDVSLSDTEQLEELRDRFTLLSARANAIRGSLSSMRKQMGSLNLNAEFTTREQRMETYMDQAESALKSNTPIPGKKALDLAERAVEELEKKLGR